MNLGWDPAARHDQAMDLIPLPSHSSLLLPQSQRRPVGSSPRSVGGPWPAGARARLLPVTARGDCGVAGRQHGDRQGSAGQHAKPEAEIRGILQEATGKSGAEVRKLASCPSGPLRLHGGIQDGAAGSCGGRVSRTRGSQACYTSRAAAAHVLHTCIHVTHTELVLEMRASLEARMTRKMRVLLMPQR